MNSEKITYEEYPWYIPAIIAKWRESGECEALARILIENRPLIAQPLQEVDIEVLLQGSTIDVIETFLSCENLRIVAEVGEVTTEVTTEVEFEDIDDLVTEELAEIYRDQGLDAEAIAIYTKLSLVNSEKSVYFAKLIEQIRVNL